MEFKNFAKALGSDLFARDPVPVSGSNAFGSGRRSVSAHQLYLYHCGTGLCLCQLCPEPLPRRPAQKAEKYDCRPAVLQRFGAAAVFTAGHLSAAGESRCAAGYVVPVVQAVECSVFAAVQSVQCRRDSFVPVVGKDSISGSVEPAAAGSGLGDLCIGEKWFPAGRTAISAEKIVPFMIGTDSFADADALRAGRFPLPVPAERSATAPVIPEAAASGCGAAA